MKGYLEALLYMVIILLIIVATNVFCLDFMTGGEFTRYISSTEQRIQQLEHFADDIRKAR
jgi:hypothetical protein